MNDLETLIRKSLEADARNAPAPPDRVDVADGMRSARLSPSTPGRRSTMLLVGAVATVVVVVGLTVLLRVPDEVVVSPSSDPPGIDAEVTVPPTSPADGAEERARREAEQAELERLERIAEARAQQAAAEARAQQVAQVADRGAWERLPDPPLSGRTDATIVGVGDQVIVFGGTDFVCPPGADCDIGDSVAFADGAAFDRSTQQWRAIADLPFPTLLADTAVVDDVVFALTGELGVGERRLVAYDVTGDTWTDVGLPEDGPEPGAWSIVAVDDGVVLHATTDEFGLVSDWRLFLDGLTWSRLPDDPLGPAFDREMVWNGDTLYLFDKALVDSPGGADGPAFLRAARFDGAAWTALDAADSIGPAPSLIDGDRLIAPATGCSDGGETNGYGRCIPYGTVLDTTTDEWSGLPAPPGGADPTGWSFGGWSTTGLVGGSANGGPFYDATTDNWVDLPPLDPSNRPGSDDFANRRAASIGDALVVIGGETWLSGGGELLADAYMWMP